MYRTIRGSGKANTEVEKSKFITNLKKINSIEEGREFVDEIRSLYKDATHNVPMIIFGKNMEYKWTSDDGEPKGTSGPPMLNMVSNEGITNIALVVTRYFGGKKLGTGGLIRAYTDAAKAGINSVDIVEVKMGYDVKLKFSYSTFEIIKKMLSEKNVEILDTEYSDNVIIHFQCLIDIKDDIISSFQNITNGQGLILDLKETEIDFVI